MYQSVQRLWECYCKMESKSNYTQLKILAHMRYLKENYIT